MIKLTHVVTNSQQKQNKNEKRKTQYNDKTAMTYTNSSVFADLQKCYTVDCEEGKESDQGMVFVSFGGTLYSNNAEIKLICKVERENTETHTTLALKGHGSPAQ